MQSDRFAREIRAFLALFCAARSQRLMRNPLGRIPVGNCRQPPPTQSAILTLDYCAVYKRSKEALWQSSRTLK
jgi:hypothetical protein